MNNLKNQSYGGKNMKMMNNIKLRDLSSEGGECYGEKDFPGVFSWPPRSYTCSFCKREFRSALALGGHMNVHRRDRARLRQSPPRDVQPHSLPNLNLDPNPNMNFNMNPSFSTTPSTKCPPFISTLPHLFSNAGSVPEMRSWENKDVSHMNHGIPVTTDFTKIKATKRLFDMEKLDSIKHEKEDPTMNKTEIIRLELEIGLLGEAKEDLDLELDSDVLLDMDCCYRDSSNQGTRLSYFCF